jgi:hypothetical protein
LDLRFKAHQTFLPAAYFPEKGFFHIRELTPKLEKQITEALEIGCNLYKKENGYRQVKP